MPTLGLLRNRFLDRVRDPLGAPQPSPSPSSPQNDHQHQQQQQQHLLPHPNLADPDPDDQQDHQLSALRKKSKSSKSVGTPNASSSLPLEKHTRKSRSPFHFRQKSDTHLRYSNSKKKKKNNTNTNTNTNTNNSNNNNLNQITTTTVSDDEHDNGNGGGNGGGGDSDDIDNIDSNAINNDNDDNDDNDFDRELDDNGNRIDNDVDINNKQSPNSEDHQLYRHYKKIISSRSARRNKKAESQRKKVDENVTASAKQKQQRQPQEQQPPQQPQEATSTPLTPPPPSPPPLQFTAPRGATEPSATTSPKPTSPMLSFPRTSTTTSTPTSGSPSAYPTSAQQQQQHQEQQSSGHRFPLPKRISGTFSRSSMHYGSLDNHGGRPPSSDNNTSNRSTIRDQASRMRRFLRDRGALRSRTSDASARLDDVPDTADPFPDQLSEAAFSITASRAAAAAGGSGTGRPRGYSSASSGPSGSPPPLSPAPPHQKHFSGSSPEDRHQRSLPLSLSEMGMPNEVCAGSTCKDKKISFVVPPGWVANRATDSFCVVNGLSLGFVRSVPAACAAEALLDTQRLQVMAHVTVLSSPVFEEDERGRMAVVNYLSTMGRGKGVAVFGDDMKGCACILALCGPSEEMGMIEKTIEHLRGTVKSVSSCEGKSCEGACEAEGSTDDGKKAKLVRKDSRERIKSAISDLPGLAESLNQLEVDLKPKTQLATADAGVGSDAAGAAGGLGCTIQ